MAPGTPRFTGPRPVAASSRIVLLACSLLVVASGARGATYDPALRWRTLPTAHFRVHYAQGLEREAAAVAEIAERVHGPLVEAVGWEPKAPTEVTIVDQTDLANGYTTILPYNQIVLFPTRPGLFQSIGDYGGWLETLFVHEYAHVLGLDPVRGYSAVFRRIFGRTFVPATPVGALFWFLATPPNVFLPPWFHEGLAVNLESDVTGRGRRDSTFYSMVYRVDVASGTVPPLDRLGGDFPDWPSWSTRYLYGARLLEAARAAGGEGALRSLVLGHSGRFPYAIDAPPAAATGEDYQGLYERMRRDLEAEVRPRIERLRAEGLTAVSELPATVPSESGPLWLDGDTIACTRRDGVHPAVLVSRRVSDGREEVLAERPGAEARPARLPDGRVAYTRVEVTRYSLYADLYAVGSDGRGERRLTRGARILEADFGARAGAYAAVQAKASGQRLVRLTLGEGGEPGAGVLLEEEGVRYDTPRWSPDGRWIAFSRKTDKGHARLAVLEVDTGSVRLLTPEGAQAGFPAWSPDGKVLAFAWDRSGVWDLYAWSAETGAIERLTRLLGGAFEPDWSPDGRRLAFTSYSARGFEVAVLDLAAALREPVTDVPPAEVLYRGSPPAAPGPLAGSAPNSPLPRALPTFWLPDLAGDHRGPAPGAWTAGADPLYQHLYYAAGYWAGASRRFYGFGLYQNDQWHPTVTLRAWKLPVLHSDVLESSWGDYDYWEEDRAVQLEARQPLRRVSRSLSLAVSWAWEQVTRLSRVEDELDGHRDLADLPFQGRLNPLAVSLLYDSAAPWDNRFTLGAEEGTRLEAVYRLRSAATGADVDVEDVVGQWRQYVRLERSLPLVAALRAKGGTGWGDDIPLQSVYQLGGEAGEFPVRGYPDRVDRGEAAFVGSAELRFPLWSPYRGARDWPFFFGRVHGAAFFDAGRAWKGDSNEGGWRRGAGAEVRFDTVLGYYLPTTLVVGLARGFDDGGQGQGYVTFTSVY